MFLFGGPFNSGCFCQRGFGTQGRDSQCCSVDLLLGPLDDRQRGHCDKEFIIPVLASVHDECAQWCPVGRLWQGELLPALLAAS